MAGRRRPGGPGSLRLFDRQLRFLASALTRLSARGRPVRRGSPRNARDRSGHRRASCLINQEWGEQDSNLRRQSQCVYSASPLTTRTSPRAACILERDRRAGGDLEALVLWAADEDAATVVDIAGGDAPAPAIADHDEQGVEAASIQALGHAAPALVSAARARLNDVPTVLHTRRRLHLHPRQFVAEVGDEVVVRRVAEGGPANAVTAKAVAGRRSKGNGRERPLAKRRLSRSPRGNG